MKNILVKRNGLTGDFLQDAELLKFSYHALPKLNLINLFIYRLHFNSEFDCLESILSHDKDYNYTERPPIQPYIVSLKDVLKQKIEGQNIILNNNEVSFLNEVYFNEITTLHFEEFENLCNNFKSEYQKNYRFDIIELFEKLLVFKYDEIKDCNNVKGENINFNKFKTLIFSKTESTNTHIKELIQSLNNKYVKNFSLKEEFQLRAIQNSEKDLAILIENLSLTTITLFVKKWRKNGFKALKLLNDEHTSNLMHNVRFIYLLVEPTFENEYREIIINLDEMEGKGINNLHRYFTDINSISKSNPLNSEMNVSKIKKLITTHLS